MQWQARPVSIILNNMCIQELFGRLRRFLSTGRTTRAFVSALAMVLGIGTNAPVAATPAEPRALVVAAPDLPGEVNPLGPARDSDRVVQILAHCGFSTRFRVQPFGRHLLTFTQSDAIDAVMTVPFDAQIGGFGSLPYIAYQNAVIYSPKRLGPIETPQDLAGMRAVTFKGGHELLRLGSLPFESVLEVTDQRLHSRMLARGRVDVIVADPTIVAAINRQLIAQDDRLRPALSDLAVNPLFEPTRYKMVFKREDHQRAFDRCRIELETLGRLGLPAS
ncbi:amino acid ABC transporter substrate-binding protein [Marinobacter sp. JSM 1782161]|uniref:amino acid ABC transporter substrate-binding protein n=1 Tax=Marinobacter sp. JSM 1782161 TaxID=2685906 RepID=UPI001403FA89|nr:amino acid ABC transporter substrate-binding protein [Marinobacter sp. JSM 1782161]